MSDWDLGGVFCNDLNLPGGDDSQNGGQNVITPEIAQSPTPSTPDTTPGLIPSMPPPVASSSSPADVQAAMQQMQQMQQQMAAAYNFLQQSGIPMGGATPGTLFPPQSGAMFSSPSPGKGNLFAPAQDYADYRNTPQSSGGPLTPGTPMTPKGKAQGKKQ